MSELILSKFCRTELYKMEYCLLGKKGTQGVWGVCCPVTFPPCELLSQGLRVEELDQPWCSLSVDRQTGSNRERAEESWKETSAELLGQGWGSSAPSFVFHI